MDITHKLKRMSEKASKEVFSFRFYKTGDSGSDTNLADRNFKAVEWFSHKRTIEQLASQGGSLELDIPMVGRVPNSYNDNSRRSSSLTRKLSSTHYLHQNEIMNSLEQRGFTVNEDLKTRSTKIICTLGKSTKNVNAIKKMLKKGMNIARLNMNYFEVHEQQEIVANIKAAAQQCGKMLAIMVDLKGPLIRTLGFKDMYSIKVESGQEIRISSNQQILGDAGMFIIDYENIHTKLSVGDKILVDYGGIILTVVGFETEEKYLKRQRKAENKTPGKDERRSDEKSYRKKRKYSANEDEFIQEEIEELINEENQEEEEVKDHPQRSHRLIEKRDSLFPNMVKLDNQLSARVNHDEFDQEEAIYQKLIKKSHKQTNAEKFAKQAEDARKKQNKNNNNANRSGADDLLIYGDLDQMQTPVPQKTLSSLSGYQMKRLSETSTSLQDTTALQASNSSQSESVFHTASSFKLQVSKEYLQRKRMSRDEFQRDKRTILKGFKKGPKSRKSNSPTNNRNQSNQREQQLNTSLSVSESDNLSCIGNNNARDSLVDKNIQSADLLDYNQPLFQKERMLVICRAENDGELKENKPIYIPSLDWQKDLKLSVLGPKDIKVLHNSIQQGVQIVAVSFVQSKEDISYVRKVLGPKGQHIKILAKLQTNKSLEKFDEILEASDGIIIARGYLGIVLGSLEDVVYIQKYIIKKCNLVGKPVILSTQIMETMVSRLMPSRAEVVDISNAVYDGIDALILSPETALGNFYEQATKVMADICFEAETHINYMKRYLDQQNFLKSHSSRPKDAHFFQIPVDLLSTEEVISSCAVKASFDVKASLIIVFTHSGFTARKVAKHKPKCQILAVTPNDWAAKGVLLHRGVQSMLVGSLVGSDTLINKVLEEAVNRKLSMAGDFVVITSGLSGTVGSTNLLKIIKV